MAASIRLCKKRFDEEFASGHEPSQLDGGNCWEGGVVEKMSSAVRRRNYSKAMSIAQKSTNYSSLMIILTSIGVASITSALHSSLLLRHWERALHHHDATIMMIVI